MRNKWLEDCRLWFDEARRDGNPYLTDWFAVVCLARQRDMRFARDKRAWDDAFDGANEFRERQPLVQKYAWAIPCEAALDFLTTIAPLVEMGAGSGYWAWLLRKRGTDVIAYDLHPPPEKDNVWHADSEAWTSVLSGGPEKLQAHQDRSLFLCWPPYGLPMAAQCLANYRGKTVVYIGEGEHGCCATDEFFRLLSERFDCDHHIDLPQWDGVRDNLSVWQARRW